jgi:hypothetical protein
MRKFLRICEVCIAIYLAGLSAKTRFQVSFNDFRNSCEASEIFQSLSTCLTSGLYKYSVLLIISRFDRQLNAKISFNQQELTTHVDKRSSATFPVCELVFSSQVSPRDCLYIQRDNHITARNILKSFQGRRVVIQTWHRIFGLWRHLAAEITCGPVFNCEINC